MIVGKKNMETKKELSDEKAPMSIAKRDEFFKKMELMFNYKSKLSELVAEDIISNYKDTYFYLFEQIQSGKLPCHNDYFCGNELAKNIYQKKYFMKGLENQKIEEKAEDVFIRISAFTAAIEESQELREKWARNFYMHLYEGHFLPGGRVLAGAGDLYRLKTLANCFVTVMNEDSIEGIYKVAYEAARTYSYGGGIGIDISQLRPKNSKVHNAADQSTGAVSFMELFSLTTGLIGQAGRRGALMLTIDVKHPDVLDFIHVKKDPNWATKQILDRVKMDGKFTNEQLEVIEKNIIENTQVRFANISIKTSDEFMSAVEEQNQYDTNKILLYKKLEKGGKVEGPSSDNYNYSYGMSKKDLSKYKIETTFDNIEDMNSYLANLNFNAISEEELKDIKKRDFYGDYVLENKNLDYDIAIRYSGDFMTHYHSKSVGTIQKMHKARDIWNAFVEGNYKTAEPGLIFWSQMSKYSPSNYVGKPIACTNPCGEVPLEDGGACNLGSINLARMVKDGYSTNAKVDWDLIKRSTHNVVRFLDNVVWWNQTLNALEKQRESAEDTRRIGVGVMGIADMFNQLGITYDSDEGINLLKKVLNHITQHAYRTSALLSKEKGPAPVFDYEKYKENPFFIEIIDKETQDLVKQHGLRNIAIMSIAPTGTISNAIVGYKIGNKNYLGVSGGIEPIFALYYTRRSEQMNQGAMYNIFHSNVQAFIDMKGLTEQAKKATNESELKEILPEHFFRTAHHITPEMRVKIQGVAQKLIDHSISSTVNLSEDIEPETISDIYMKAWKQGLKGITIYRDGSRYPILSVKGEETEFQKFKNKKFKIGERIVSGNEVIAMPDGTLSTIYHAKKGGKI
jgi:ribonucleoside-diphosphate reductase alpha chain